ncbi:MAG: hypothetical protein DYH13_07585 [Alphaproteobacteria bacterium PRO2]|nr:hypothetical protein [Alphaproteobacteria bacterium PRO2]
MGLISHRLELYFSDRNHVFHFFNFGSRTVKKYLSDDQNKFEKLSLHVDENKFSIWIQSVIGRMVFQIFFDEIFEMGTCS